MAKKIHKLLDAINFHKEEDKLTKEELLEYIRENYPDKKLSSKQPWLSTVTDKQAKEILSHFANVDVPFNDLQEHIFLQFPHKGQYTVLFDRHSFEITTSRFGTTDLCDYKGEFHPSHTMRQYADECINILHAKEITYDEFVAIGMRGEHAVDGKVSPIKLVKPEDYSGRYG